MDYNKIRKQEKKGNKNTVIIIMAAIAGILALVAVIVGISFHNSESGNSEQNIDLSPTVTLLPTVDPTGAPEATEAPTEAPTESLSNRGTAQSIPADVRETMDGCSMHDNDDISYDDLSYLTIPHYDFNYSRQVGHLVVNKALAEEVLDIFAELYDVKYPIERMELVDVYGADDYESIEHNNTSAFNYRKSTDGTSRLSKHALGRAIDINPQINPYVESDGTGSHDNAAEYWSRDPENWSSPVAKAAYIGPGTDIYRIFVEEHGWEWGGSWSSYRDYQHFQKF